MIPKIIHYVWLGGNKKNLLIKKCMKTWKKRCPNFQIKCWNESNIPHNDWVDSALAKRKWAFVADYVRLYALYQEGGIYLDTDVFLNKSLDSLLDTDFFIPIEMNEKIFYSTHSDLKLHDGKKLPAYENDVIHGLTAQSGIIGSVAGSEIVKTIMHYYESNVFAENEASLLAPNVIAKRLEKFGFRYKNENQVLQDSNFQTIGKILDTSYFASGLSFPKQKNCIGIHAYSVSWKNYSFVKGIIHKAKIIVKTILL